MRARPHRSCRQWEPGQAMPRKGTAACGARREHLQAILSGPVIRTKAAFVIPGGCTNRGFMNAGLQALSGPIRSRRSQPARSWIRLQRFADERPRAAVEWAELIGRVARQGDRQAFKLLFEHFAPRVKGFLIKNGMEADAAEEIAQGTLLAVWRKAGQFDPASGGAAAWIFTIARNLRIDAVRRLARQAKTVESGEPEQAAELEDSPETVMSRRDDVSRVSSALLRLSEEQSTVIRMSFIEERPHAEIAETLGIPLGTVKSRIRLAMRRLKDLLDD